MLLINSGLLTLIDKNFGNDKKNGLTAVEVNPENFQFLSKKLRDEDVVFDLAIKTFEKIRGYAGQRFRNTITCMIND